ncbi:hypothetical protein FQA39_LY09641 [Lamprigera yunnana]|nr:hypothetical protein FQA39_LY09641 [Lamprigera yunnana]
MPTLIFLYNFLKEHPLSCCYDEINNIKKQLNNDGDELKLKQKASAIVAKIVYSGYYINTKIIVPDCYPDTSIEIQQIDSNFPPAFQRHISGQIKEIARQCIEPPLRKAKPHEPPFKAKPSLEKCICFLINCIKLLPKEKCQLCKQQCLPLDPQFIEVREDSPRHIERIYCGHLFHNECLLKYLKTPPFGIKNVPFVTKKYIIRSGLYQLT